MLENVQKWCQAFYHPCKVNVLKPINANVVKANKRIKTQKNQFDETQYDASGILFNICKDIKTKQRGCLGVLAITDLDLYTGRCQNFVYGAASLQSMVGIQSLRRYMPDFSYESFDTEAEFEDSLLKRICKTATHELGHMFGLKHCIYYEDCLMRGNNGQEKHPLHLCPVCYHKLHLCLNFEHVSKAKALMEQCEEFQGQFVSPELEDGRSFRDFYAERFKVLQAKIKPEDYGVSVTGSRVHYADKIKMVNESKKFTQVEEKPLEKSKPEPKEVIKMPRLGQPKVEKK